MNVFDSYESRPLPSSVDVVFSGRCRGVAFAFASARMLKRARRARFTDQTTDAALRLFAHDLRATSTLAALFVDKSAVSSVEFDARIDASLVDAICDNTNLCELFGVSRSSRRPFFVRATL